MEELLRLLAELRREDPLGYRAALLLIRRLTRKT